MTFIKSSSCYTYNDTTGSGTCFSDHVNNVQLCEQKFAPTYMNTHQKSHKRFFSFFTFHYLIMNFYSTLCHRRDLQNSLVEKTHHIQRTEFDHQLSGQDNGFLNHSHNRCWVNVEINWSHWRTGEFTYRSRRTVGTRIWFGWCVVAALRVPIATQVSNVPSFFYPHVGFSILSVHTMKTFTVEGRYLPNTFER